MTRKIIILILSGQRQGSARHVCGGNAAHHADIRSWSGVMTEPPRCRRMEGFLA